MFQNDLLRAIPTYGQTTGGTLGLKQAAMNSGDTGLELSAIHRGVEWDAEVELHWGSS